MVPQGCFGFLKGRPSPRYHSNTSLSRRAAGFARKGATLYIVVDNWPERERQLLVLAIVGIALLAQAMLQPFDNRAYQILDKLESLGIFGNIITHHHREINELSGDISIGDH